MSLIVNDDIVRMIRIIPILNRSNYRFSEAFCLSFNLDRVNGIYHPEIKDITEVMFKSLPVSVVARYRRFHGHDPTGLYCMDSYNVTIKEIREFIDTIVTRLVEKELWKKQSTTN